MHYSVISLVGEMLAAVHVKVINEYKEEWGPGCCLVLRQVNRILYSIIMHTRCIHVYALYSIAIPSLLHCTV